MPQLKLTSLLIFAVLAAIHARAKRVDAYPMLVKADGDAAVTLVFENEPLFADSARIQLE